MRFFCLSFREGTFPTVAFPRSDGVPGTGVTEEPGTVGVGGTGPVSSPFEVTVPTYDQFERDDRFKCKAGRATSRL